MPQIRMSQMCVPVTRPLQHIPPIDIEDAELGLIMANGDVEQLPHMKAFESPRSNSRILSTIATSLAAPASTRDRSIDQPNNKRYIPSETAQALTKLDYFEGLGLLAVP